MLDQEGQVIAVGRQLMATRVTNDGGNVVVVLDKSNGTAKISYSAPDRSASSYEINARTGERILNSEGNVGAVPRNVAQAQEEFHQVEAMLKQGIDASEAETFRGAAISSYLPRGSNVTTR